MKHTKEYAVLVIVIVALGLYLLMRDTDRTTYTLPDLQAIKAVDITKIEIATPDQTVVLTRSGDHWQVSPGDYAADEAKVKRMLDALATLDVTALVSETRTYGRYELDEPQRIGVKAYQNDAIVRDLGIGKAADTMRHTHIVLAGDPKVYHARGNFRNDFDQSVADLRDRTVLAFDSAAVSALTVETAEDSITLTKSESAPPAEDETDASTTPAENAPSVQWETSDGRNIDNETVQPLLNALSGLQCRTYLENRTKDDLTDPTYRVRIEADGTSLLDVFAPAEAEATELPATSSLRTDPFTLADFDIEPIEDFLTALKEKDSAASASEESVQ
jgi:hypothetical protein